MDNGDNERAVTNSLKEIVKYTSKRKGAARVSKHRSSAIRIAPKSSESSREDSSSSPRPGLRHSDASAPVDDVSAQKPGADVGEGDSVVSVTVSVDRVSDTKAGNHFSRV
jgi:hypothetical protein